MSPVIPSGQLASGPSISNFNTTKLMAARGDLKRLAQSTSSCIPQVLPIPAPNQGPIIALGLICCLLIISIGGLWFFIIKISRHYREEQDELKKRIKAHQRMIPGPRFAKRYLGSQHRKPEKRSTSINNEAPPQYQDSRRGRPVPDRRQNHTVFPSNLGDFGTTDEKGDSNVKMFFPHPGTPLNEPRYPPRTQTDYPVSVVPPAYLRREKTQYPDPGQRMGKDEDEVSEMGSSDGISSMKGEISEVSPCSTVIERRESKRSRCSKGSLRCKRR